MKKIKEILPTLLGEGVEAIMTSCILLNWVGLILLGWQVFGYLKHGTWRSPGFFSTDLWVVNEGLGLSALILGTILFVGIGRRLDRRIENPFEKGPKN